MLSVLNEVSEDIVDKGVECFKEVFLYTPSGAVVLQSATAFLPVEITHLVLIFCCPLIVVVVKERRHRKKRKTAAAKAATSGDA